MRKLVFAALMLGGLAQATGCIITSDDDDDTAQFEITWNLTEGANDTAAACADIATIQVVSELAGGQEYIDLYDCIDGWNATAPLPLGDYTVWVNALASDDTTLLAQSSTQVATLDLGGELVPLTFTFPVDGGFFGLTWNMVDNASNALTCEEVIADGVEVLATLVGTADATADIFDCTDYEGVTDKIYIGSYTVVVNLLDGETLLGDSEPRTEDIEYGNHLNDLGNFEFVFAE